MSGSEAALTADNEVAPVVDLPADDSATKDVDPKAAAENALQPVSNASGIGSSLILNGVLVIAISLISGVIGAVIYERMQAPPPRIMVLDMGALLKPIANDPSLNALEKRRITEDIGTALEKAMQAQADSGAIVLDASVVLKAPGESYVQP